MKSTSFTQLSALRLTGWQSLSVAIHAQMTTESVANKRGLYRPDDAILAGSGIT